VLQEIIDVAVILNALRASMGPRAGHVPPPPYLAPTQSLLPSQEQSL
jgi:hypothetical protein